MKRYINLLNEKAVLIYSGISDKQEKLDISYESTVKEDLLKEDPTLQIEMIDERLTTVSAHRTLSMLDVNHKTRKDSVDRLAACEILDTYIRKRG